MATILDVVNDCLATMGQTPLNTLNEPHTFKAAARRYLDKANRRIQSYGWWANTEYATYYPAPETGHVQLPGDALKWESGVRNPETLAFTPKQRWIVMRGNRLYDTQARSYVITETQVSGKVVREIPFEELPPHLNDFVASEAVLRFQSNYDSDTRKREELTQLWSMARAEARAEDTRQRRYNAIVTNPRLARIKRVSRGVRNFT